MTVTVNVNVIVTPVNHVSHVIATPNPTETEVTATEETAVTEIETVLITVAIVIVIHIIGVAVTAREALAREVPRLEEERGTRMKRSEGELQVSGRDNIIIEEGQGYDIEVPHVIETGMNEHLVGLVTPTAHRIMNVNAGRGKRNENDSTVQGVVLTMTGA